MTLAAANASALDRFSRFLETHKSSSMRIGGGFSGIAALKALAGAAVDVRLRINHAAIPIEIGTANQTCKRAGEDMI